MIDSERTGRVKIDKITDRYRQKQLEKGQGESGQVVSVTGINQRGEEMGK